MKNNAVNIKVDFRGVLESFYKTLRSEKLILVSEKTFLSVVSNEYKIKILSLLSRGPLKASEISSALKLNRVLVYKYLNDLVEKGFIEKKGEFFSFASDAYLVYKLVKKNNDSINIEISSDKAILVNYRHGLILVSRNREDLVKTCVNCVINTICSREIDEWAKRYRVKVSEDSLPAQKIVSILARYINRRLEKYLENGFIIIRR